ncbi:MULTISPECIES: bifunctional diguanylate cyclase/phosphodiesterase [unclassified Thioalkalivibrio]|uniref:putative bifunctional diguanylate cyclase/phosphodiesterase n=1 Tax=unclassified Thioalkalivibrio TaxID=2621013 RepID=UPI001E3C3D72|nr:MULTISPECIES: EAL domain-containing protein [unclassified Thioalkalivibrio]
MSRPDSTLFPTGGTRYSDYLARSTLRSWVGMSFLSATLIVILGLLVSWSVTYLAGGADNLVPHLYYVPILIAAARFGPGAALIVALTAGILAGPLTYVDVAAGTAQETERWLTRTAFFVGIGQLMAWLVIPALTPVTEELRRMRQEFDIRRGLRHNEFFLRYQPIYSSRQRRFVGVEALIRWQHPVHGELTPVDFLDVAEGSSLIHDIGKLVIAEACRQTEDWKTLAEAQGQEPWYTAINLSARDLIRPELAYDVASALKRHHLPPELLTIELTETVLALEDAEPALEALNHLGVQLAIDDFGTGYSSLAYLNRFPIDTLKLDRQLVSRLDHDPSAEDLARGIVLLASSLGLKMVAEGVETQKQVELGHDLDFDLMQGFYFARPLRSDEVPALLLASTADQDLRPPASFRPNGKTPPTE